MNYYNEKKNKIIDNEVYSKVKDKITPAIETKVETILDAWFGAEFEVIA